ncbi:BgTH12-04623 [Blumeria graminis f. sp. triticale]|uniref:BgTH12-04623 n=1 Tax=Blumeria graminis f. sp. triticale TaxID=1689686 RepID=A0A9W4GAX8_BLUGR|nr:BgTH12-04623 [Blumeria graminis f. sp. triticale]
MSGLNIELSYRRA